jgi:allantoicase
MDKKKYIFLNGLIDLAQSRLGTKVVYKTDEFFAAAKRIINPWPPVFKEGVFDKHGKWMDGWETRRKRAKGNDCLILKLGKPGKIHKVDIDTSYFNGNQPSKISLEACCCKKKLPPNNIKWINILKKQTTKPNSHHFFKIKNKSIFTHVKLNIYPDGGVARIRVYGEMQINKKFYGKTINLTSVLNGATPIACNNEHFGRAENILASGVGKNMGDGWETKRSRGKNFDWLILKCATAGKVKKIQIDTHHFKGNYPDMCSIQAAYLDSKIPLNNIVNKSKNWKLLLKKVKLKAHKKHNFINKLMKNQKINYIKINIYPDGGISRIRIFGKVEK